MYYHVSISICLQKLLVKKCEFFFGETILHQRIQAHQTEHSSYVKLPRLKFVKYEQ